MCIITPELQHMGELKITNEAEAYTWFCGSLNGRNVTRIIVAASCSTAGTYVAARWPVLHWIIAGAGLSGIGNATSTYFFLEPSELGLIEARFSEDLPNLRNRVFLIEASLEKTLGQLKMLIVPSMAEDRDEVNELIVEKEPPPCVSRETMNRISMTTAGAVTTLGSLIAGFIPTPGGIIAGSILTGVGNSLSTILPYKRPSDQEIAEAALEMLPAMMDDWKKLEPELIELIEKIMKLHPEIQLGQIEIREEEMVEEDSFCCFQTMKRRNASYLFSACCLSSTGALTGSFFPNIPGIIFGGAIGGAANGMSTALVLERPHDRDIQKALRNGIPDLLNRIERLKRRSLEIKESLINE